MSPAWSGSPERCEYMSPTVTICVTAGSDSANHGSLDTIGVSQPIAFTPTWCATTVDAERLGQRRQLEDGVGVDSVCLGIRQRSASLTPKPLAYTVFPPCTTATAMPGMPDLLIRSSAMPSSLATALSTAFSGKGIAGTSGGGTSD